MSTAATTRAICVIRSKASVNNVAEVVRAATLAFAALMPIVNPLGSAPIFLSMSADLPTAARRQLSRQVA